MQGTPYQVGAGYPQYTQQPGHHYYPSAPISGAPAWHQPAPVQPPVNNQFGQGDRWGNPFDDKEENVLFHTVADGDTLMGLSLTYGVTVQAIKKANGITSDEIYYMPSIKIPNPKRYKPSDGADDPTKLHADKSVTLKQAFKNRTGESDPEIIQNYLSRAANNYQDAVELYEKEKNMLTWRKQHVQDLKMRLDKDDREDKVATFYLEISDWNFDQALKAYKEDLHHGSISSHQTPPPGSAGGWTGPGVQPPAFAPQAFAPAPYYRPGPTPPIPQSAVASDRFVYSVKKDR